MNNTDTEILRLLANGCTTKEVAGKVYRSPEAIRDRLHKLRKKHGCKNTLQLIAKLINLNLI
jgi:DNA-binding NarL/FixJ family response regulator